RTYSFYPTTRVECCYCRGFCSMVPFRCCQHCSSSTVAVMFAGTSTGKSISKMSEQLYIRLHYVTYYCVYIYKSVLLSVRSRSNPFLATLTVSILPILPIVFPQLYVSQP